MSTARPQGNMLEQQDITASHNHFSVLAKPQQKPQPLNGGEARDDASARCA